ncbi:unnamed protein product [Rotaria sp. Silwood2]|nr:unnamed protein product [Rotaria sp. Silwood2]CAF3304901.1 unnamed protein product [Rotaria sp. Silwood2]CAF4215167.1 unnamed protein product [Rotaria sp. Silwood2]CAF4561284.1 unnamed protein product [Rotaria sp. Silwood2]
MTTLSVNKIISTFSHDDYKSINIDENDKNIILVCFDPANEFHDDTEYLNKRLNQINSPLVFHSELESCITFIQSIDKEKVFVIISDSFASQILSYINNLHQVDFIFVFSSKKSQYEHLLFEYSKIIGIYDKFDLLCSSIDEQIDFVDKKFNKWTCFDQDEYLTKDLTEQLFHDVILYLPRDEISKKQMIDACRFYYQENFKELSFIDEFEQKYQSNEAIHCESSHQQEILFDLNTTFRLENIQEGEQIWIIKMIVVNDGQTIIQKYIDDIHRQIADRTIPIIFGKLICDMSQWNQSQLYFQHLFNDSHRENLAQIEHHIGQAHQWKGE